MSENIDWSNREIEQLALNLNNIGLHLRNAIACMYNTCTRLANNGYWTGYNFNIVAEFMNKYIDEYNKYVSYYAIEVPNTILQIAEIQAQGGGGIISTSIQAEGDRDWLIQRIPTTTVNASGDQTINIDEVNKFLEDPGTAVSLAYFVHGSENDSIAHYLTSYMNTFDEFYNAIKNTESMQQVKDTLDVEKGKMLWQAKHFYELVKAEAKMTKNGIIDTNEDGKEQARRVLEENGITSESLSGSANNYRNTSNADSDQNSSNTGFVDAETADSKQQDRERKELYDKLDTNKDGRVDLDDASYEGWKEDFQKYKDRYGVNPINDTNADGKITEEDVELRREIVRKQQDRERKELYDKLDTNKDGIVTNLDKPSYERDKERYKGWVENYEKYKDRYGVSPGSDHNADGKITEEDKERWREYELKEEESLYNEKIERLKSTIDKDTNGDGIINDADMEFLDNEVERTTVESQRAQKRALHEDTQEARNLSDAAYAKYNEAYDRAHYVRSTISEKWADYNKDGQIDEKDVEALEEEREQKLRELRNMQDDDNE